MTSAAISSAKERAGARSFAISMRVLPPSAINAVSAIWQDLERQFGEGALTSSWDWTGSWLQVYGEIVPHRFAVGYIAGRPIGVALLTQSRTRRHGPILLNAVHVGTSGEPDSETVRVEYNRLLVDPRFRVAFAQELLRLASRPPFRCKQIFLDGFSPDELNAFAAGEPSMLMERHVTYVTELRKIADSDQTVLDALRRHTAAKIRRTMRRLEEAHGPISVQWAETLDEARDIFDELCALHNARWRSKGLEGAFASERFSRFHRALIERLFPVGRILLARVRAGETTIGCDYGMIEHGRVLSYQWGIARFEDSRLSPGLLTGAVIMQAALERGLSEYDWLAGDVLYKRELSTSARELIWARHTRGLYIQVLDAAARTAKVAHRTIRKRPIGHHPKPA